jgi:exo-1,4-beta-D-glucosaminidase
MLADLRSVAATLAALLALACMTGATAAADTTTLGLAGWSVRSAAVAAEPGGEISLPGLPTSTWLSVKPDDAGAVGTEIGACCRTAPAPKSSSRRT